MKYPTLYLGQRNKAVAAMQCGLHRALHARGIQHHNKRNGAYGTLTKQDINRFKHAYGIRPVQGKDFGGDGEWKALIPYLGAYDKSRIAAYNAAEAAKAAARKVKEAAEVAALRMKNKIAAVALEFYNRCKDTYVYRQYRPMPSSLYAPEAQNRLDCSSTATLVYKEAGAPDPNGLGYNGYGYTGTLWPNGEPCDPEPGALAFYGTMAGHQGAPSHVAICISATEVISFGSTPIKRLPLRYRSDYRGCRRYRLS